LNRLGISILIVYIPIHKIACSNDVPRCIGEIEINVIGLAGGRITAAKLAVDVEADSKFTFLFDIVESETRDAKIADLRCAIFVG